MKAAACASHVDYSNIRACFQPACALRAKPLSCAQCLAHTWEQGLSRVCGSEMNWYCLQHLLASFWNQDPVSPASRHALPRTHIWACSPWYRCLGKEEEICVSKDVMTIFFILKMGLGSKEFYAPCI